MRILHCCLAAFYIDNFSYQENILPRIHKRHGHDVAIVASTETYLPSLQLGFAEPRSYQNIDGIPVTRIPYAGWVPKAAANKLRIYEGLDQVLASFKPEVIFLHDCQFLSVYTVAAYARKHKVTIYVDSHTDFINSGRGWVSKNILHKILYRHCVQKILPFTTRFYGTLPLRNAFLHDVYGVPKNKISLLPFGADDTLFSYDDRERIRKEVRAELQIGAGDFVLVTGGKIDARKNIDRLLQAFQTLRQQPSTARVWLVLFGKPNAEMKAVISGLVQQDGVVYLEWLAAKDIHRYMFAADLAVFPGTHSVLWEEAAGLGLPLLVKRWYGIEHLDVAGNCLFLENATAAEIAQSITNLVIDSEKFEQIRKAAAAVGPVHFSYSEIARRAISETN